MRRISRLILGLITLMVVSGCNSDEEIIIPTSSGAVLDIGVGGPTQPNQVYVDLSTDNQTIVNRGSWDLGFSTGDEFVTILNASAEVMARAIDKIQISDVVETDYAEFKDQTDVDIIFSNLFNPPPYPEWLSESSQWIDDPDGSFSKTAIPAIQASAEQNLVYYISRGKDPDGNYRGEYLIHVTRNGNGYKMDYLAIGENQEKSIDVAKDAAENFIYFNFDQGEVGVEPPKDSWDIAFTTYMEKLDVGGGLLIPYRFKDYVVQNRSNTEMAVRIIEESESILEVFEIFTLGDVAGLEFRTEVNSIGSTWRTVQSPTPGSVTGVQEDRFYIVKDSAGNHYKLLFTQMLNTLGERGFPQISYALLQ